MATTSTQVFSLIERTLKDLLDNNAAAAATTAASKIPEAQKDNLETIIGLESGSYRNAVLAQLAYRLEAGVADLTVKHPGGRTVTKKMGTLLAELHVPTVKDAFENIGKNSTNLTRDNVQPFDDFLQWATDQATPDEIKASFRFLAAELAKRARPVKDMPELALHVLSFAAVMKALRAMYTQGSKGAYEQYSVAAFLEAMLTQSGIAGFRVDTKSLNASDRSSGSAADVQVFLQNQLLEGFEVTANDYGEKLEKAAQTVKEYDLARAHIVARVADQGQAVDDALELTEDVSVIELEGLMSVLTALLKRPHRALALQRMYQLLDRHQSDVKKVNGFVDTLVDHGLTVS